MLSGEDDGNDAEAEVSPTREILNEEAETFMSISCFSLTISTVFLLPLS